MLMCAVMWPYTLPTQACYSSTRRRGRDLARGARVGRRHLVLCAHGGSQCGLGQRPAHFKDRCRLQLTVQRTQQQGQQRAGARKTYYSVEVVCYHPRCSGVIIHCKAGCAQLPRTLHLMHAAKFPKIIYTATSCRSVDFLPFLEILLRAAVYY